MTQRIYIDGVTNELVKESPDGTAKTVVPGFSELTRYRDAGNGSITVKYSHTNKDLFAGVVFSDALDEAGAPYASLDAFWDALTPYFTS